MAGGRFLNGLFEKKSAGDAVARAAGPALATAGMPLSASAGNWDLDQGVQRGMESVAMVFRCVDAIAQTQARIPMQTIKITPNINRNDAEPIDDIDVWKLLNFRANSYETSFQFRYRLSAVLLLSQRGAFVEMVKGANGKIESLHLLAPGRVQPVPHPTKFVSAYHVMRGDSVENVLQPDQVCWIKSKPHPVDPYRQLTPLMSAGISANTDLLARMFNINFLRNDGRPGMLITIQGKLNREDAEEVKQRFSGGVTQAGRTTVLEADGIDAADMSINPRDMQWAEMITGAKEDIQLAFGVPESVMGNASGRTFDNADAERENFYIDTVQTHCEPIAMGLDPISGATDDDIVCAYDYSGVDVLQRIAARKREEARAENAAGLITIDEYRERASLAPFNVVGTRVLFHSSGLAFGKTPEDQAGIMQYKPIAQPPNPGEGLAGAAAAESGALKGVQRGIAEGDRQRSNTQQATAVRQRALAMVKSFDEGEFNQPQLETKARADRQKLRSDKKKDKNTVAGHVFRKNVQHPYMGLRFKMEGMIEGQLIQWDQRQEQVTADRLHHAKLRKGTRHWEETKALPKRQKCKYCTEQATKRIIHAEGMAYVPVCEDHLAKGKDAVGADEVSAVHEIKSDIEQKLTWTPREFKALDSGYVIDEKQWTADLTKGMGDFIRKAMVREAKNAAKNMQADGISDISTLDLKGADPLTRLLGKDGVDKMMDPIYTEVMDIIATASKNQTKRLKAIIEEMDDSGASLKDIERKVRQTIGSRAPWRKNLSINVTTTAVEAARKAVYDMAQSGLYTKTWNSEHDARVRPSHLKADGQTKAHNQPFRVGGFKMDHPCDPAGPIQEKANCRCYATYSLSDRAMKRLDRL